MGEYGLLLLCLVLITALFGHGYLMVLQPRRWAELFMVKPAKALGLSVSVDDERQMRRELRALGTFLPTLGVLALAVVALTIYRM